MVHLYNAEVQQRCVELGLTSKEKIKRKAVLLKVVCLPIYLVYLFLCVFTINKAQGFFTVFGQLFVILFVMNLIDRFLIDGLWVGHTKAWIILGTEDLMPYITKADKRKKMVCWYGWNGSDCCHTCGNWNTVAIRRNVQFDSYIYAKVLS